MARIRKPRTITMSDEVFDGLKAVALYHSYRGNKAISVSSILEELAREYLKAHSEEVKVVKESITAMERIIQPSLFDEKEPEKEQLSLLDFANDSAVTTK